MTLGHTQGIAREPMSSYMWKQQMMLKIIQFSVEDNDFKNDDQN